MLFCMLVKKLVHQRGNYTSHKLLLTVCQFSNNNYFRCGGLDIDPIKAETIAHLKIITSQNVNACHRISH